LLGIILCVQPALAASGLFPKMPAATNVYVVNIHKDSGDAWMTAWALQGLINQKSAEVYLINNPWDRDALNDCGKPYIELPRLTGTNAGLRMLFRKYQGQVKKMFIYDPEKDWTWYLASMSGAQQGGIPVTESVRDVLISEFGWKGEVEDFRNRWANRIEAYDWALIHLMPSCTKQVVFATGNRRLDAKAERIGSPITDYAVASKGFVFGLDFAKPAEHAEIGNIFSTKGYGVGTSLMGYASNGDQANETANRYGIGYVVSELYANGSFWSSFPDKAYTQSLGKAIKAEPGKVYASFMWSDGDNLEYDQNPLYRYWKDPARGQIPVATGLATTLQELNPPLLNWYYSKTTTNDELMAGATGVQFIHIRDFNQALFPAWCELNHDWCASAGFHSGYMWLMPQPTAKYTMYSKTCGLVGVVGEFFSADTNLLSVTTSGIINEDRMFPEITYVQPKAYAPVFHNFTLLVGGFCRDDRAYAAIKRQIDRIEAAYPGRYVFLLPKDEFATIRAYYKHGVDVQAIAGRPDAPEGLYPMSNGDGEFSVVEHNGVHCWLVPKHASPNYFYLDAADDFLPQTGGAVEIDLTYFDSGAGDFALDYDSTDVRLPGAGAFKRYPYIIHRTNSGQLKTARFYVNDARFSGRENGGADFRFYSGGDDLIISFVQVQRVKR